MLYLFFLNCSFCLYALLYIAMLLWGGKIHYFLLSGPYYVGNSFKTKIETAGFSFLACR